MRHRKEGDVRKRNGYKYMLLIEALFRLEYKITFFINVCSSVKQF